MVSFDIEQVLKDSIEYGGGFLVGSLTGRYFEKMVVKTPVTITSSSTDKLLSGAANNGSKIALYWLLNEVHQSKIAGAVISSAVVDVLLRIKNQGVDPLDVRVGSSGFRILNDNIQSNNQVLQLENIQGIDLESLKIAREKGLM